MRDDSDEVTLDRLVLDDAGRFAFFGKANQGAVLQGLFTELRGAFKFRDVEGDERFARGRVGRIAWSWLAR